MKKASVLLVAIALAAFGLAACGGDDDDDSDTTEAATTEAPATETEAAGGAGGTIDLSAPADGSFAYDTTEVDTAAGTVTVNFDNPAPLSHNVVIEDDAGETLGETDLISESTTSTTVDLQPGSYTFYCSVPGHREGGMEGTLTAN